MACQHREQQNFDQNLSVETQKIAPSCLALNVIFVVGTERELERLVRREAEVTATQLCDQMRAERSLIIKSVGKGGMSCLSIELEFCLISPTLFYINSNDIH